MAILNPVLNEFEQDLAKKFPIDSLTAYKLSFSAEAMCGKIFYNSLNDDESDACRHFMWAYLMAQNINSAFSKKILAAHEKEPNQPKTSKEMDEHNNSLAIKFFKTSPNLDEASLRKHFLNEINSGLLRVNKPNPKNRKKLNDFV